MDRGSEECYNTQCSTYVNVSMFFVVQVCERTWLLWTHSHLLALAQHLQLLLDLLEPPLLPSPLLYILQDLLSWLRVPITLPANNLGAMALIHNRHDCFSQGANNSAHMWTYLGTRSSWLPLVNIYIGIKTIQQFNTVNSSETFPVLQDSCIIVCSCLLKYHNCSMS